MELQGSEFDVEWKDAFQLSLKGRILILGELSYEKLRYFDPQTLQFVMTEISHIPNYLSGVCEFGAKVFSFSGCDHGEVDPFHTDSYVLNLANAETDSSSWINIAPMPLARTRPSICALDSSSIGIFGGMQNASLVHGLNDCWVYHPEADTYTSAPKLPSPYQFLKAVNYDGCVYLPGAYNAGTHFPINWRWDPRTPHWDHQTLAPMPATVCNGTVIADEHGPVVIGGYGAGTYFTKVFRYDVRADRWSTDAAEMKQGRSGQTGHLTHDGYVYQWGGFNAYTSVERYDLKNCIWETIAFSGQMPEPECATVNF